MDENKLSYRRIRNDVHIRLNNKEAATFLALMFYSDFNTGESHIIHKTLRDKTGIPESTLKKYLKELAEKEKLTYIDLYSHFVDPATGKMNINYTNDGVHLLGKGYLKWVEIVKPYITKK